MKKLNQVGLNGRMLMPPEKRLPINDLGFRHDDHCRDRYPGRGKIYDSDMDKVVAFTDNAANRFLNNSKRRLA